MNFDSSSSTSSDEIYDSMLLDFIEENRQQQVIEDTVRYVVNTDVQEQEVHDSRREKMSRWIVPRDREGAHDRLVIDYFSDHPLYGDEKLQTTLVTIHYTAMKNATMRLGASGIQKCTAAMRMLAYGCPADQIDEYLKLGASTARECLIHFVDGVIREFSTEYLRKPKAEDLFRLLKQGEERGFPGMMGSIDCMHWECKNCPAGWKGMYQGRSKRATVILEAVVSWDLWIWHAFFGTPGTCNDINVLQHSPVFDDILNGRAPQVNFTVNGNTYNQGYYLTYGIYPKWATFISAITSPQTPKQKLFTIKQESIRKDVECAFGVLQARFVIIRHPALAWSVEMLWKIVMACIIMHNMIVEDERDNYMNYWDPTEFSTEQPENLAGSSRRRATTFTLTPGLYKDQNLATMMATRENLRDKQINTSLKNDLLEHNGLGLGALLSTHLKNKTYL
ncbi:uncharacterized protein LOC110729439 [Chenopodium quinoa]|uniref:uncharacterized protein LOC110729439 n=1 Tax=Chenopodium quinoa TaxID=63459 RepID=UPI000B777B0C|nr:uncharacterized protein LOC110729439 [Chenopodium quinoa]